MPILILVVVLANLMVVPKFFGFGPFLLSCLILFFCFLGFGLGPVSPSERTLWGFPGNGLPCSLLPPSAVDGWMISGA